MKEWITGRNPVYETLRAQRRQIFRLWIAKGVQEKGRLAEILELARSQSLEVEWVSRDQVEYLGAGHQGVALEVSDYPYCGLTDILDQAEQSREPPLLLILDMLQDPQNLGTLLRTAQVVGVHGVLLPYRRTATVTPAVVSASSGGSEHLSITQVNLAQSIRVLKEEDVWVIGLEGGSNAQLPGEIHLDGPIALVVGNEGEGMRRLVRESCDLLMRLPMRGKIDSLNAAVAGSVALYLVWQARNYAGQKSGHY
jgi:23S rRNA (guanosine2251-2'-O)-methyltransferase